MHADSAADGEEYGVEVWGRGVPPYFVKVWGPEYFV